jgi:Golgi phosphoprotein 3 (GPP34)
MGLDGTGRVADDLCLMAHREVSGTSYVQPRALGLGLAGALLAEAMLGGYISVRDGQIVAVSHAAPAEPLSGHLLGVLAGEGERHPVRDWLEYLGRSAAADVARRLEAAGYLKRAGGRWRGERWVPVDADSAFAPILRVRAALDASRPLTIHGGLLAGLADACGLGFRLALYTPARSVRPLH